jgi:hypothetical protein
MTDQSDVQRRDSVTWAAAVALARLTDELGRAGEAAMATAPALLARVDQHAADVRDTLCDPAGTIALTALAAYADGVRDVAALRGVDPVAAVAAGWAGAPWPSIRLLAVHLLAESATGRR